MIHILYTGCVKIKKNNSSAKRLMYIKVCFLSPKHSDVHQKTHVLEEMENVTLCVWIVHCAKRTEQPQYR